MNERALRAALLKLQQGLPLACSQFTSAQREALDQFARQTGSVTCQRQGRGDLYIVSNPVVFKAHLSRLSPKAGLELADEVPLRAQHIAKARDSKAGAHQHPYFYPLIKAVGEGVRWQRTGSELLELSTVTQTAGAATLAAAIEDDWFSEQELWLVENQALFDRPDWLPTPSRATVLFYSGQLDGRLLAWLVHRPRASRLIHFPDYDGVGLANFRRLHALLGETCEFWLMPEWQSKLRRWGSREIWQDTLKYMPELEGTLPAYLQPLISHMRQLGLALEQEAVWLPAEPAVD